MRPRFLLDTNILSELLRPRPSPVFWPSSMTTMGN